ncbi:hypothetical protein ACN38_g12348 [Penicillium nordicum]|uniref:Uncharacterized protein n=1 Tax=Penicillium nordicum TaxID=229535 RepID=A0A0M9W9Z1_9EURO|nr:hypothetical protein ACN38_g12348 [Penicillium nordicum]
MSDSENGDGNPTEMPYSLPIRGTDSLVITSPPSSLLPSGSITNFNFSFISILYIIIQFRFNSDSIQIQFRFSYIWWLANSSGEVRIVLVISISKRKDRVFIEVWQLAPPNSPRPLTRAYIQTLCQQSQNVPPLVQQPAVLQQAYCAHEVEISANGVTGAPLTLPFVAVYDRPPAQGE